VERLNAKSNLFQTDSIDFYLVHAINQQLWTTVKEAGIGEF